ncbi:uncharacterized protein LOC34623488 [Cyclospora cayetanensis]|uniref:Uncharacterized protein LOC34623488 n=1 Tax=Cyclospora cayetanensis TaxID=88456 RepID=A0A6P6S341_9EIME|nr:uncharacterized protein LOC34623488 [Cyclospora cayetanensis]
MSGSSSCGSCGFVRSTARYLSHRLGRLYDSFYNSQSSTKFVMCFAFPAAIFSVRYRTDTKLAYHVFIAEPSLYPDLSHKWVGKTWENGRKYYLPDHATVKDLKELVYSEQKPLEMKQKELEEAAEAAKNTDLKNPEYHDPSQLLAGCRGRMFEDSDNLALAVKAFCRRDPKILIWKD